MAEVVVTCHTNLYRCAGRSLQNWKSSPLIAEGLLRFAVDENLSFSPSLVGIKTDQGSLGLAMSLRSEWKF